MLTHYFLQTGTLKNYATKSLNLLCILFFNLGERFQHTNWDTFFCGGIERNTFTTESDQKKNYQKIEIAVNSIQETPLKFILNKKITLK